MFTKLVNDLRHTLLDAGVPHTMMLRQEETPPSAVIHLPDLDGNEYLWILQPTKVARLLDAGEPNPPEAG